MILRPVRSISIPNLSRAVQHQPLLTHRSGITRWRCLSVSTMSISSIWIFRGGTGGSAADFPSESGPAGQQRGLLNILALSRLIAAPSISGRRAGRSGRPPTILTNIRVSELLLPDRQQGEESPLFFGKTSIRRGSYPSVKSGVARSLCCWVLRAGCMARIPRRGHDPRFVAAGRQRGRTGGNETWRSTSNRRATRRSGGGWSYTILNPNGDVYATIHTYYDMASMTSSMRRGSFMMPAARN